MSAELIGTAFVAIRAVTAQLGGDIKDGIQKGSKDAQKDSDKAGRDLGDGMGAGVGEGLSDRLDVEIPGAIKSASDSKETRRASDESGKSLSTRIADAFHNDSSNFGKRLGDSLSGALSSINLPGGALGFLALNALPLVGGALQVVVALGAQLVAMLGFIATAAAGAGVALLGVGSALALGIVPLLLAFKAETPALEAFKEQAKELLAPFQEIGEAAQEGLLPGLLGALGAMQDVIPRFKEFGRELGFVVGDMARLAAEAFTSDKNLDAMGRSMASSITVWENISRVVVSTFGFLPKLIDAAMPSAVKFSDSIAKMFEGWSAFISTKSETGELTETFGIWYDRLALIGRTLGDLFVGLWNVFSIGGDVTAPMFENLAGMAQNFRDFTSSMEGENKIASFFQTAQDISSEVFLIIRDIFRLLIAPLVGATDPQGIIGVLETFRVKFLPAIAELAGIVAEGAAPLIGALFEEIGRFLDILAENPEVAGGVFILLGSSIQIFTVALRLLNDALDTEVGMKLAEFFVPILVAGKVMSTLGILTPLISALAFVLPILGTALGVTIGIIGLPIILIVAAIAAVIGAFALLYFHLQPFRDFVDGIIDTLDAITLDDILAIPGMIMDAFGSIDFASIPGIIGDALGDLGGIIGDALFTAFQTVLDVAYDFVYDLPGIIRDGVQAVIGIVQDLPARIGEITASLYSAFVDWAVDVGPQLGRSLGIAFGVVIRWFLELPITIANLIVTIVTALANLGASIITFIINLIPQILSVLATVGLGILTWIISVGPTILATFLDIFLAIPGFIASALDGLITVITTVIGSIPTIIGGILSTLGAFLYGVFEGAWPEALSAITGFLDNVGEFFGNLPGDILGALISVGLTIAGVFTGAIGAVGGAVGGLIDNVVTYFTDLPGNIVSGLVDIGTLIAGVFTDAWTTVRTGAQLLFDDVVEFFTDLPGEIVGAVASVGDALISGLGRAFRTAWNAMIGAIPSFTTDLPGPLPKVTVGLDFLKFAMGGIVNTTTFAMLGEAGREAVIPLTNPIRALELMRQTGLDRLALGGSTMSINNTTSSGAALHIEHATFNDPVTADIVAAKVRAAIRL